MGLLVAPLRFGRFGAELSTPSLQAWVACLGSQDPPPDPALRPEQDGINLDDEQSRKVGLLVAGDSDSTQVEMRVSPDQRTGTSSEKCNKIAVNCAQNLLNAVMLHS